jgi:hypothetical protein
MIARAAPAPPGLYFKCLKLPDKIEAKNNLTVILQEPFLPWHFQIGGPKKSALPLTGCCKRSLNPPT